ncbi:hypothetical protein CYMTET_41365 [Cymbomonas tetramitiformis]|uniref:UBC core domain-containing protein n=1 Tax=Cymbomonas tetramitiformis TaxID=36881 RepID=A0AAE0C6B6_9CHLO|nr:hypothetical protein CYMTET_41365 [Cymbomonas tetramitiformis]|eukprot:gene16643-19770_t
MGGDQQHNPEVEDGWVLSDSPTPTKQHDDLGSPASTPKHEERESLTAQAAIGDLNDSWIFNLFPQKPLAKRQAWLQVLIDNEFETTNELRALDGSAWESLDLPLAIKSTIRQSLTKPETQTEPTVATPLDQPRTASSLAEDAVVQVDCIVMDISGSMRARSAIDQDKTREDVSKMLFHTLVDKLIALELSHAVGLLAFGETVTPTIGVSREYERFHDELGRLDANEKRTRLYDSILRAAEMLEDFSATQAGASAARKRIFVLTDGADNASQNAPWHVAQFLQQRGIVLDAIPLAGANSTLHALCASAGGLCFDVVSQEQGVNLFEREATLHLPFREAGSAPTPINDLSAFSQLLESLAGEAPVRDVSSAVKATVFAPVLSSQEAKKCAAASKHGGGGPRERRVMQQFSDLMRSPLPSWQLFVTADNFSSWKLVLSDLPASYAGGTWLLTLDFENDYPIKPPKLRFVTPIYHCNITQDGRVCLPILSESWSPAMNIREVLEIVKSMILQPDYNDPLDVYKGQLCRDDRPLYDQLAAEHTVTNAGCTFQELASQYNLQ